MKNLPGGMFRQLPPNNEWTLGLPIPATSPVPLLDTADDTGKFVKGILLNREKTLGKRIYGATDYYTLTEIVDQFKELYPEAGKTAKTVELPHQVFKGILKAGGNSDQGAEELLQNMRLLNEFGYYGGADLKESQEVCLTNFMVVLHMLISIFRSWLTSLQHGKSSWQRPLLLLSSSRVGRLSMLSTAGFLFSGLWPGRSVSKLATEWRA